MLRLILMRHAKSSWDNPAQRDHDRPLNKRGRGSAKAMGDWLRKQGHVPDCAISSTAVRTTETFDRLALNVPVALKGALYHASPETMIDTLRQAKGRAVLMLGHNPGIASFAQALVAAPPDHHRFFDYPTCATLVVDFDKQRWNDVGWRQGITKDFVIPREL